MKTLSPAIAAHIQTMGTEPVNILEVAWTGGNFLKYGDKETAGVAGTILNLSNLESVVKLDSQGQSQSISVTLEDSSGDIKDIINTSDIHGKAVRLTQWFEGLPLDEAFVLYEGEISSPIIWSEGDRTISFSVITKLADKEVGFSPEEGNFPFLVDRLVGKAWPMAFGIVQNVPAIRLQEVATTQSSQDLGVVDPSLNKRIREILIQLKFLVEQHEGLGIAAAIAAGVAGNICRDFGDNSQECQEAESVSDQATSSLNANEQSTFDARKELSDLLSQQKKQKEEANEALGLVNVDGFPDGPVTIDINGIELSGTISGEVLTIDAIVDTNFDEDIRYDNDDEADNIPFGYTFIEAGTTVTIKSDAEISYIANIIDSTVLSVQAFRQAENGPILITISSTLYTVTKETSGPYTFTIITFKRPLSSLDEELGDDIFVTLESPIGPNTVDIMIWLIDTYTDLSFDKTSFDYVKLKIDNYPSHFAMLERKNILTMLEEMAFQARCSIWISNGVFYIKYLSEEVTEVATITETDIDAGSLVMEVTETEEVVTKLTATWTDDYALDDSHTLILRHNIKKYGTREREINFYIYNIGELVQKSATFWLIRLANVWKILNFDTYTHNLALESFDTIKLAFGQNFISTLPIKAMVTDVTFNTSDYLLNLRVWVPIRFGEMEQYDFSWPSQILPNIEFPTRADITEEFAGGDGPGADVDQLEIKITIGRPQIKIGEGQRDQRRDYGEEFPSDLDDIKPEPNFAGVDFLKGDDPDFQYDYGGKYGTTVEILGFEPIAGTFPGRSNGVNESVTNEQGRPVYTIDVYLNSLAEAPRRRLVIMADGSAPNLQKGHWVTVMKNFQAIADSETGERFPGLNEDGFEWTMTPTIVSSVYPGKIISPVNLIELPQTYNVELYFDGLQDTAEIKIVHQLQGAINEEIPVDTWVLVSQNDFHPKADANENEPTELTGLNEDGYEYTMQVPVWL